MFGIGITELLVLLILSGGCFLVIGGIVAIVVLANRTSRTPRLTTCPRCGKPISATTPTCPECGVLLP